MNTKKNYAALIACAFIAMFNSCENTEPEIEVPDQDPIAIMQENMKQEMEDFIVGKEMDTIDLHYKGYKLDGADYILLRTDEIGIEKRLQFYMMIPNAYYKEGHIVDFVRNYHFPSYSENGIEHEAYWAIDTMTIVPSTIALRIVAPYNEFDTLTSGIYSSTQKKYDFYAFNNNCCSYRFPAYKKNKMYGWIENNTFDISKVYMSVQVNGSSIDMDLYLYIPELDHNSISRHS